MARIRINKKSSSYGGSERRTIQVNPQVRINERQAADLKQYIEDRLEFTYHARDSLIDKLWYIDQQLAGQLRLGDDDKKRQVENSLGKSVAPVDFNLQLTASQIDEAVTYLMEVLAPEEEVYSAVAPPRKMSSAKGLTMLMNNHAKMFKHQRHYARAFRDGLAYNFGGLECDWRVIEGNQITTGPDGAAQIIPDTTLSSGNEVKCIDMYNVMFDISVDPIDIPTKGEFYATVELMTPFRLKKMVQDEMFFNLDKDYIDRNTGGIEARYWRPRPHITYDGVRSSAGRNDWVSIFSGTDVAGVSDRHEIVKYTGWIIPKDFGLSQSKNMEIWCVKILNRERIVYAKKLEAAHEMLPCAFIMPLEDGMGSQTKSVAEQLIPLQRFASHEMNVRQRDARKKLYGMIVYDEQQIPLMQKADLLGGKVPARPASQDRDIRKAFARVDDPPITDKTMDNVQATINLMQQLVPTDMLRQVASLDRATSYQAAAVVQSANRKNHKMAMIINQQGMMNLRFMQIMNIYQFAETVTLFDEKAGQEVRIEPSRLRGQEVEFKIGSGLKGLDRLTVTETLKDMATVLVQNAEAARDIDIVMLLDYITDLLGDKTNFGDFRIRSPIDALSPEEKNMAFQLLQRFIASQESQQGGQQGAVVNLPAAQ